jgi:phage tail sheath gpL-like
MGLVSTSRAAAVGTSISNVKFAVSATVLTRKIILIGTYDPLKTAVVPNVPVPLSGPQDAGTRFGFGTMLHRLSVASFTGSNGVETWAVPQEEAVASVAAVGDIDFTGSIATENATMYLYIAGLVVPVNVVDADTATDIALAVVAAVTAEPELPVSAVVNVGIPGQVDFTAKSTGPWGELIDLSFNWGFQQELPGGVLTSVTAMTGGSGLPDIQDALDALGTDDDKNENYFTDGNHGYGQDSTTLDIISTWNGLGNTKTGLYDKLVHRPIRFLDGDTVAGTAGKNAVLAIGTARRALDRTNGIIVSPGSPNHPMEIAALAMGIMAKVNSDRAEETYIGQVLPGVFPGAIADRWVKAYDDRDAAVKSGISPTKVVAGTTVVMQNVLTFYHPTDVDPNSNGWASMRNISITQNILAAHHANFDREKWRGFSIVADVSKVSNVLSREKARDISAVRGDLIALAEAYEGNAWIFTKDYTIERLQSETLITIRPGGIGFNTVFPVYYSGEGGILDNEIKFDIDITALV